MRVFGAVFYGNTFGLPPTQDANVTNGSFFFGMPKPKNGIILVVTGFGGRFQAIHLKYQRTHL